MLQKTIQLFTEKEYEFVNLLIEIGIRKNVAKMLVYLVNIPEATTRDIECGTDMRQPEVSLAIKYLAEKGWIKNREIPSDKKGRPIRIYALAVPVKDIIVSIEKQKKNETSNQLARIRKMRNYF
jgi:predicted transcriptional regulator